MRRPVAIAVTTVGLALALAGAGPVGGPQAAGRAGLEADARRVVSELFRTINERRYERSCDLLVAGVTDHALCVTGLRVGFLWSQEIHFRITGVQLDGDRAVVTALADRSPGRVVLVRLGARYRVVRVEGP
jgi:hypothetical protein